MDSREFKNYNDEINKYSNKNSLILDLGSGGREKCLSNMPDVGMIIATDFSPEMILQSMQIKFIIA